MHNQQTKSIFNHQLQTYDFFQSIQAHLKEFALKISQWSLDFVNSFITLHQIFKADQDLVRELFKNFSIYHDYQIHKTTSSPICSKIVTNSSKHPFKCYDCMEEKSSLLCYQCFLRGNHEGHRFFQDENGSGSCDCGNNEFIKQTGFCPNHKNQAKDAEIPQKTKKIFLQQMKLVFFIYFVMIDMNYQPKFIYSYGKVIFEDLLKMIQLNYEMKVLCFSLFEQNFKEYQQSYENIGNETIIEKIFKLDLGRQEFNIMVNLIVELFPVEKCRVRVIQLYFDRTYFQPFCEANYLKGLNYQYIICAKTITNLIKQQELRPLQINPSLKIDNMKILEQYTCKYLWDLHLLTKMSTAEQYNRLHFQLINVSQMPIYREYAGMNNKRLNFDNMFVKIIGKMIRHVRNYRDIIGKCLKELLQFIFNFEGLTYSRAQERLFALFMFTYLEGNFRKLNIKSVRQEIISVLGYTKAKDQLILINSLKRLIKKTIKDHPIIAQNVDQYYYTIHQYPERNLPLFLDYIFLKSILLLSQELINHAEIVSQVLRDICQSSSQNLSEKCQNINIIVRFLANLTYVQLDKLVIGVFIEQQDKQNCLSFYRQLLESFGKLNVKEFKDIALEVINSTSIFQQFMNTEVIFENKNIFNKNKAEPLPEIVYDDLFKKYHYFRWSHQKKTDLTKIKRIDYLSRITLFNEQSISIIASFYNEKERLSRQDYSKLLHNLYIVEIIAPKVSKETFNIFRSVIGQNSPFLEEIHLKKQIQQMLGIQNQIADIVSQEQITKNDQRKRLMDKKRLKQQKMQISQFQVLQKYKIGEPQVESNSQTCIFCRESSNQILHYIGYCNIGNFVEKYFMKSGQKHIFFTTCGHRIHSSCYHTNFIEKNQYNSCILCKSDMNILIPEINSGISEYRKEACDQFLNTIIATLLFNNGNEKSGNDVVELYDRYGENTLSLIIDSVIKEAFLKPKIRNQQNNERIYTQLLALVFTKQREQIKIATKNLEIETNQDYLNKLKDFQNCSKQNGSESIQLVISTYKKVTTFEQLINHNLFIKIPQTIRQFNNFNHKCNFCLEITNWIYFCIFCSWNTCLKEQHLMQEHVRDVHCQGSVFICPYNGRYSVITKFEVNNFESIYENAFGQAFSLVKKQEQAQKIDNFKLNRSKLDIIYKHCYECTLHNCKNWSS